MMVMGRDVTGSQPDKSYYMREVEVFHTIPIPSHSSQNMRPNEKNSKRWQEDTRKLYVSLDTAI